ncbi:hypothetical protein BGZ60DRAFT_384587 [Tricladium varicosporioides]|nr:hypothetical protein BGZ60DRAFT_384587 [Hymenoscyphus varicosporioides]
MSRALLITGATGKQGGAVVNALLRAKADLEIFAVTRNAQSRSAQNLLKKSSQIKLIVGNLDNPNDIFQKARQASHVPIWGVYSVQVSSANPESEERQGKALIDASVQNGVKHFVYSSVDRGGSKSDTDPTNVPHFISKYNVEQYLFEKTKTGGMKWTVLRPVAFFENLVPGFVGKVFSTSWEITLKNQTLQLIAASDIGVFAAEAFLKPKEFENKKLSLAGDELTYDQFKKIFKERTGQALPTTFTFLAVMINWMVKDLGYMFKWFRDVGYGANISELRKINPELKDFGTWLDKESQFKTH